MRIQKIHAGHEKIIDESLTPANRAIETLKVQRYTQKLEFCLNNTENKQNDCYPMLMLTSPLGNDLAPHASPATYRGIFRRSAFLLAGFGRNQISNSFSTPSKKWAALSVSAISRCAALLAGPLSVCTRTQSIFSASTNQTENRILYHLLALGNPTKSHRSSEKLIVLACDRSASARLSIFVGLGTMIRCYLSVYPYMDYGCCMGCCSEKCYSLIDSVFCRRRRRTK